MRPRSCKNEVNSSYLSSAALTYQRAGWEVVLLEADWTVGGEAPNARAGLAPHVHAHEQVAYGPSGFRHRLKVTGTSTSCT